ncbi:hypothetical protein [Nautilia sp.]
MKKILILLSILSILSAQTYTQKLSYCLIRKTSVNDRILLAKWMFVVLSQYPELKSLSNVTPKIIENYNKKIAALIERLLTKDCKKEASMVIKHEPDGLSKSFNVLGTIAAREIMLNPRVSDTLKGYTKYMNIPDLIRKLNE